MNNPSAEFVKSVVDYAELPNDTYPQVAMFGRSNVGKSSLINSITGKKGLSRTSTTPGRTQMINLFKMDKTLWLVDLPGYGYAKASATKRDAFQQLIGDYIDHAERLVLAIAIIDSRLGPTELDIQLLIKLEEKNIPFVIVANKVDKLSQSGRAKLMNMIKDKLPGTHVLFHSAKTGEGRGEISEAIQQARRT